MTENKCGYHQEIIPTSIKSKTDCNLLWSIERCQFGRNWNKFKEDLIEL